MIVHVKKFQQFSVNGYALILKTRSFTRVRLKLFDKASMPRNEGSTEGRKEGRAPYVVESYLLIACTFYLRYVFFEV